MQQLYIIFVLLSISNALHAMYTLRKNFPHEIIAIQKVEDAFSIVNTELKILLYATERINFHNIKLHLPDKNQSSAPLLIAPVYYWVSHPTKDCKIAQHQDDPIKVMVMEHVVETLWNLKNSSPATVVNNIASSLQIMTNIESSFSPNLAKHDSMAYTEYTETKAVRDILLATYGIFSYFIDILPSKNHCGEKAYCKAIYKALEKKYLGLDPTRANAGTEFHSILSLYDSVTLEKN